MTSKTNIEDVLDVLACEIDTRPKDAPTFEDLAPAIVAVRRTDTAVVVDFKPEVHDAVSQLVAAEQQCCSTIGWRLDDDSLRLTITARSNQLDTLFTLFQPRD